MVRVPASALYGFRRFADDEADTLTPPAAPTPGFSFFQYLLLSITAGVTTHYIIRALERKRK